MDFTQWLRQLDFQWFLNTAVLVAAALLCIIVHELCHGLAAYRLGDPTAKAAGRLTLNPLRHIDWVGLLAMAIFKFGWARPVPVNARNFKHPKLGMALTALAGPVSNLLLAILFSWIASVLTAFYKVFESDAWYYLILFLEYVVMLSVGLAVFNLFPIPPLDGSKILFSLLPDRIYAKILRYEKYGMLLLVVLLFFNVLDTPLLFLRNEVLRFISSISQWPYNIMVNFLI